MIPMNIKSKAGFTLVELIVVIAILGILAGIAVPAYSGYIKKANAAADTQVLSAANTALAAAMTENGLAPGEAKDYVTVTSTDAGDGTAGCTIVIAAVSGTNASKGGDIVKDFDVYYGNTAAADAGKVVFEYYDTLDNTPINNDGTLNVTE